MRFFQILSVIVLALILVACGPGEPAGYQATIAAAAAMGTEEMQAQPSFGLSVSGDMQFRGDTATAERRADGMIALRVFNQDSGQGVSIVLPPNAAVGKLPLSSTGNAADGVTTMVLTAGAGTAVPGSMYNRNPSGFFDLTAIGDSISGNFAISVENETGGRVTASGEFVNLAVQNE